MEKVRIPLKEKIGKLWTSTVSFLDKYKKSTPAIIIYVAASVCLVVALVVTFIHNGQAKEIQQAQLGKCYITHYASYKDHITEIYYFHEDGFSNLYISYLDAQRTRPRFVYGSMEEIYGEYSAKISLFGTKTIIDSIPIELDENNQIITYGDQEWSPFSYEEAVALEKKSYALKKLIEVSEGTSIGPDDFSTRMNDALEFVVAQATASSATESDYIGAAKSLVSDLLKNPDSAIYNTQEFVDKDPYGRAIVHLNVSAQNSLGGYVRNDYYVCLQSVHGGNYTYFPSASYVKSFGSVDFLKTANNWNQDPALAYEPEAFMLGQYTVGEPIDVGGFKLIPYIYQNQHITYIAYIEEGSNYTVSSELVVSKSWFSKLNSSKQSMLRAAIKALDDSVGYSPLSVDYSASFDLETGKATEIPTFIDGYVYHARERKGKIYFSCTNTDAFSFDINNYWAPSKNISTHPELPEAALFDKLSYSKVWVSKYAFEGFTYNCYFAFEENGSFYFALGELDVLASGAGTYTVNQDNVLNVTLTVSGKTASYAYAFNPDDNSLTVVSNEGIVGSRGEKHILQEDQNHSIDQIKTWASYSSDDYEGWS